MQLSVKEDREKWIGGSDIPAIMGISPFITRYDLLLLKANIKQSTFEGNEYTEYGNVMESKIRDYINELYNTNFVEGKHEDEKLGFRCHTDGENEDTILEIKTTSQLHDSVDDYKIYLVQLLFYMMNTKKKKGWLAVYKRPQDFDEEFDVQRLFIYQIDIDDYIGLCNEIRIAVEQFKIDLNKIKANPLLTEEDLLPASVQELSDQIAKIENQLQAYKELEQQQKKLKEKLYEQMELNGIKSWETTDKKMLITRVDGTHDQIKIVLNEERLKKDHKEIYDEYCEEKIKKGISGYVKITIRDK